MLPWEESAEPGIVRHALHIALRCPIVTHWTEDDGKGA